MHPVILQNAYVQAEFSPVNGRLLSLRAPEGPDLVHTCECCWSDWRQGDAVADVTADADSVHAVYQGEAKVESRFTLRPDAALLEVTFTVSGGTGAELKLPGIPSLEFAAHFLNPLEDPRDLNCDGSEMDGGRELPCWRVFFREGYADGLLFATRTKEQMSHLQVLNEGFMIRPHIMTAYSTDYNLAYSPITFADRSSYSCSFELGPWTAEQHQALLTAARLEEPMSANHPPITAAVQKPSPESLPGTLIDLVALAGDNASPTWQPNRWMITGFPGCLGGKTLACSTGVRPPALEVSPGLSGVYRVFVGVGSGQGAVAQFSGDDFPTIRTNSESNEGTPFHLHLSGPQTTGEVLLKTCVMDDRTITLSRFRTTYSTTCYDYLRFERLSHEEEAVWRAEETAEPRVLLTGLNDIPDIARLTDGKDPDPMIYAANLWEHANSKVRRVFWRIDGQCSDYDTKVPSATMRYVCGRNHGLFHPHGKAYGRALLKTDMLRLAVDTARRYDLELYGWMRFNNYAGNVKSAFFVLNPQWHEEWESGTRANKLCLAFPEVRKHKIDILVEAAGYGLAGICLGFLRHPPVFCYAPVLVDGFRRKYGEDPPRNRDNKDQLYRETMPPDDEAHRRWYQYRADFLTQFLRELRAALAAAGHELPICAWLRPNHCLFDGIDLDTWLDEGLIDGVLADDYFCPELCEVTPEWKAKVQAKSKLIRGVGHRFADNAAKVAQYLSEGYDGINTYESDYTVLDDQWIELYRGLRR